MSVIGHELTVAISRQRGSGGSYVGRSVAERLGLRYIDRDLLRVAAEYFNERDVAPAVEARPSFWSRLEQALTLGTTDSVYCAPSPAAAYEADVFKIQSRLIQEIVVEHATVIVGRGAAQTLRRPKVLTVFIHAPEPWRVERVQQVYKMADREAARKMVVDSDRDRARMVRSLANIEWTDARAYDLALDASAIGFDAAVDLIVRAVASRDHR